MPKQYICTVEYDVHTLQPSLQLCVWLSLGLVVVDCVRLCLGLTVFGLLAGLTQPHSADGFECQVMHRDVHALLQT